MSLPKMKTYIILKAENSNQIEKLLENLIRGARGAKFFRNCQKIVLEKPVF
jgi:hypothetical protein